jgi:integrase
MKGSRDDQYTSREIAMHPELVKALKAQHMVTRHSDYVFPADSHGDTHVNPKLLHKRWLALVEGTAFEHGGRWHMPRHSLASLMAAEGHDQRDIDGIIGHSTKQMADRYRHLMPQQKRAAVETLKAVKIG